jgi:uncharacterized membrane protein YfcA
LEITSTLNYPAKRKINFHLVIIACPFMFFGSLLGVEMEVIAPPLVIMIAMTTILSGTTFILIKEYIKRSRKERNTEIITQAEMASKNVILMPRKSRLQTLTAAYNLANFNVDDTLMD